MTITNKDLAQFIGTEHYYRLPFSRLVYSDGVKFLIDKCQCSWLLEAIAFSTKELERNYIIEKDLDLWRQEAESFETSMWLGMNIRTLYKQSFTENGLDTDITTLMKTLGKMAGQEIPKTR